MDRNTQYTWSGRQLDKADRHTSSWIDRYMERLAARQEGTGTGRQLERQVLFTERQAGNWTGRHMGRQAAGEAGIWTGRQLDRKHMDRQAAG